MIVTPAKAGVFLAPTESYNYITMWAALASRLFVNAKIYIKMAKFTIFRHFCIFFERFVKK